jgi:predicted enzyme related to lactoylglutathione lyase
MRTLMTRVTTFRFHIFPACSIIDHYIALAVAFLFTLLLPSCILCLFLVSSEDHSSAIMKVHYLEIITPNVSSAVAINSQLHNITFSPAPELGNAQIATLPDGSTLGIRPPMHDAEMAVIRPYMLVDDIDAAVKTAESDGGATIAVPPMVIKGRGRCAIYILDGVEYGLWEIK